MSPGIISTLAAVTKDPTVLLITLGFAKPSKKNSAVVTFDYANPSSIGNFYDTRAYVKTECTGHLYLNLIIYLYSIICVVLIVSPNP